MSAALEAARTSGLLPAGEPVTVLLSGGRDSVCLLDCAVTLGARVRALHVDYGLRETSAADASHCEALCARLGVPLEVVRPLQPERPGNLQAWARDVRYAAGMGAGDGSVATGHTASDQVEGLLYRLAASPGRRALLGMPAREGRLVRPLLSVGRRETTAHCRERGLGWRDDPTNETAAFARNRARHGLLPALQELHPAAEANVLRTLDLLRDEAAVLDDAVARARDEPLGELPPSLARLVLQALADEAAGGRAHAVGHLLPRVVGLGTAGSKRVDLGRGLHAVSEYGRVRVERPRTDAAPAAPVTCAVPGAVEYGDWTITAEAGDFAPGAGVVPAEGPLTVRAWRPGDRMRPAGAPGSRSLQDLFCDRKVPRAERSRLPVVCSPAGEVLWVPGVATAAAPPGATRTRLRAARG